MKRQRYVMIRGQVFRWEEKEPFVASGKSVLGAVEVNPETRKSRCHECGEWFESVGKHVTVRARPSCGDHPTVREYKIRHGLRFRPAIGFGYDTLAWKRATHQLTAADAKKGIAGRRARGRSALAELRNEKSICDAQVPFRLQSWAAEHGYSPTCKDVPGELSSAAITRYGTWSKALIAAGLETNKAGSKKIYGKELLKDILRDFYVYNRRLPKTREWGQGRLPNLTTFKETFGSVRAGYEAAGLGLVADARYHQHGAA